MILTKDNDVYKIVATDYSAEISENVINIILCGESVVRLLPRTALDTTNDDDETWQTDIDAEEVTFAKTGDYPAAFEWKTRSSLWSEKIYKILCYNDRVEYYVTVTGKGRVDSVKYFMRNTEDGKEIGGKSEFFEGFFPNIYESGKDATYPADCEYTSMSLLSIPPMFVHAYKTPGISKVLSFGVVGEMGEHNFTRMNYSPKMYFTTDQTGHVYVDGTWTAPRMVIQAADSYYNACERYSDYYFTSGICKRRANIERPRFWLGPIACGWLEQGGDTRNSREPVYNNMLSLMEKRGLHPRIVIIDDRWMKQYGPANVDTERWPDLRGWIDRNREKGIHTFLWFRLWENEGMSDEHSVWDEIYNRTENDPTHPAYREQLREIIHRLISSDEGCYNADGLKVDFAFMQPRGRKTKSYTSKYGAELLYEYLKLIHDTMKEVKPHAVMNASPCHPIFDSIIDHARLHDYESPRKNLEEFAHRAKIWGTALPGALIDMDSGSLSTNRDVVRFLLGQADYGIPDLYYISDKADGLTLTAEEWSRIAEKWDSYCAKMDMLYGEDTLC